VGSVHAVRDLGLLRIAAMKVLAPNLAASPREVQRFTREAQITAQLDHPNIAPVYEIGVDRQGNRYFTMKRIEGTPSPTGAPAPEGKPVSPRRSAR
jgi:eukaryotic-like serine/threonine-protein kinase